MVQSAFWMFRVFKSYCCCLCFRGGLKFKMSTLWVKVLLVSATNKFQTSSSPEFRPFRTWSYGSV